MLHFDKGFPGSGGIHGIVLVFHFNVDRVNYGTVGQGNSIRISINDIPTALRADLRNVAVWNVLKNPLMEIADVVVV